MSNTAVWVNYHKNYHGNCSRYSWWASDALFLSLSLYLEDMHTVTVSWLLHTYLTFQLFIGSFSASVSSFIHQVCFHFTFSWCTNFPTSLKSKNLFAIVYFVDFHIFLMCIKSSEWKSIEWSVVCQVCEVNVGVWPPVAASSLLCSVWICEDSAAPSQTDDLTIKIKILHSSHFKWQNLRCVSKSYRFQESGRPRPPCQMKRN